MRLLLEGCLGLAFSVCFLVGSAIAPVQVERVHLVTGEVFDVTEYRMEGEIIRLSLSHGVQILFDANLIAEIEPVLTSSSSPGGMASRADPAVDPFVSKEVPLGPYDRIIRSASERHDIADELLHALIAVESSYRADAESPQGALGLMQLMPGTARDYGVKNPFNPAENVNAGAQHLRSLLDKFGMRAGLAAYNAGEASVRRFGGVPPYAETHRYVDRILEIVERSDTGAQSVGQ